MYFGSDDMPDLNCSMTFKSNPNANILNQCNCVLDTDRSLTFQDREQIHTYIKHLDDAALSNNSQRLWGKVKEITLDRPELEKFFQYLAEQRLHEQRQKKK